jgi:hypothetical protein
MSSDLSVCNHTMSWGINIGGRRGLSSTVAGTSVIDSNITSTPDASTIGHASGQITYLAAATAPAPSTADISRSSRYPAPQVDREASIASHPKRAKNAITTITGPL